MTSDGRSGAIQWPIVHREICERLDLTLSETIYQN